MKKENKREMDATNNKKANDFEYCKPASDYKHSYSVLMLISFFYALSVIGVKLVTLAEIHSAFFLIAVMFFIINAVTLPFGINNKEKRDFCFIAGFLLNFSNFMLCCVAYYF